MLVERDAELHHLQSQLDAARGGQGALVLVRGEAGIGKTSLLDEVAAGARERGSRVLTACGGELERDFAWGVARQLYEAEVRTAEPERRVRLLDGAAELAARVVATGGDAVERPVHDATLAVNHGLYWLTVNLADEAPLVLVVDDLHWADSATLLFLAYLARRVADLPVLVLVAMRPAEPGASHELLSALVEAGERRDVPPLSEHGSAAVIERWLGVAPAARFLRACHEATGGNPFLLGELLRELQDEGRDPDDAAAERVAGMGPRSIARSVLGRLGAMWPEALALAQAVAVLGTQAEVRLARALAGLDAEAARSAADALTDAGVLAAGRPLRFVHPVLRRAVYEDVPAGRRATAHARAARLLEDDAERAAVHLLATDPEGDPWVVAILCSAAASGLVRGSPGAAVRFLRRALEEPPTAGERASVLHVLGMAAASVGDAEAIGWLEDAVDAAQDSDTRLTAAISWSMVTALQRDANEASREFHKKVTLTADVGLEVALHAHAGVLVFTAIGVTARRHVDESGWPLWQGEPPRGNSAAERSLLAAAAWNTVATNGGAAAAHELAVRGLGDGELLAETGDSWQHGYATRVAIFADAADLGLALCDARLEAGRRRGSMVSVGAAYTLRALVHLRRGALAEAEADALGGLADAWRLGLPLRLAVLADVLRERGRPAVAAALLTEHGVGDSESPPRDIHGIWLLEARARLQLAQGQSVAALADLQLARDWLDEMGHSDFAAFVWRVDAALAHHATGDAAEAAALADAQVTNTRRFGAPTHLGMALRVRALVGPVGEQIALLRESLAVLEDSPARLERAKTLVELGAALRRSKHRRDSRAPLEQGMEEAHRCGAAPLAERARDELLALGARPRRFVVSGVDALTASERRVAAMAASGMTNREIAQALFVTQKTVEVHLSHAYQKLDIRSRRELDGALAR